MIRHVKLLVSYYSYTKTAERRGSYYPDVGLSMHHSKQVISSVWSDACTALCCVTYSEQCHKTNKNKEWRFLLNF